MYMKAKMYNYKGWVDIIDSQKLKTDVENMLLKSKFNILNFCEYTFAPYGYTAVWILAESHCAIHTFPEENKTYIELTSCVKNKYEKFKDLIAEYRL
ncbi:MAG TPA: spermidine synthase [Clostridiales bacterium]|nr:MAG: hypothetical protein A2Y22_08360 [Clostridiales bacterium GWD2_32_59]HAN09071.1 spermidine synthase [Clostridiales bacterium]